VGTRGQCNSKDNIFFYGKGKENHLLGTQFFVQQTIESSVKGVEFVSNSIRNIVLRISLF